MTIQGLGLLATRYRFRFKRILALLILLTLVLFVWYKVIDNKHEFKKFKYTHSNLSIKEPKEDGAGILYVDYVKVNSVAKFDVTKIYEQFKNLSEINTCPACYGVDYCSHAGIQSLDVENIFKVITARSSQWDSQHKPVDWLDIDGVSKIQLSLVHDREWERLESFVCKNSSLTTKCQPTSKMVRNILGNPAIIKVENIANLYKSIDKIKNEIPLLICATEKLVDQLKKSFDLNNNGIFSADEQSVMLSSILTNQAYALMKVKKQASVNIPIPKLLGACGRLVFREKDWSPLTKVLDEPFEVRAGIALQLLQTVEDLQDEDPDWYFFNTDFSYDSLMRNSEGEVVLTNLEDIAIVDKSLFPPYKLRPLLDPDGELCNELCFQRFTRQILDKNFTQSLAMCSKVAYYGQLMQALVCKQLFSNLEEHKSPGFFNFDGNKIHKKSEFPGLLHSVPDKDRETVEDLLRECVQETNIGGRKQAVDELREILEKYLNYDDQEEKVSNRNEDDDDNAVV